MSFDFFEGAAGTGKTHSLVRRAGELVGSGSLDDGQKLLALTFMNGARRRLVSRFSEDKTFRTRFDCQTFDVFARTIAMRRRSLITRPLHERAATLGPFDGPCALAAELLQMELVRRWVASSFPLVVVDEAQDLDEHRSRILQGLAQSCQVVAAADAFQCLHDGRDTTPLIDWLETAGETHRLSVPRRTNRQGLLGAALAVREGRDIRAVLTPRRSTNRTSWSGAGFRLIEATATAKNIGLLAWSIANEMDQREGQVVILTPDAKSPIIKRALETVRTRQWPRNGAVPFGPFDVKWEREDSEEAANLLAELRLPETASCADLRALLAPFSEQAVVAHALSRLDRLRRVQGQVLFTADQVAEIVRESVRNRSRLGLLERQRGHLAMTIQRAKNREFQNVIVLWPHTATGSADHLRRLLYNGITRAQRHCTVIVLGQGRLESPPFSQPDP